MTARRRKQEELGQTDLGNNNNNDNNNRIPRLCECG